MCACSVIRAAGNSKAGPWNWRIGRGNGMRRTAGRGSTRGRRRALEITGDSIHIDGVPFTSKRLQSTLQQAEAHSVILAAVGAGPEAEEESRRRWEEEKPDEYFFLEIFASAVVEHLITATGARLCDWAEHKEMAVLPHLQSRVCRMGCCGAAALARADKADAKGAVSFPRGSV